MKINWGTGIAIFYSVFVLIMILMVVKSSRTNINMVQEDYYDRDLNYEEFRKSRENAKNIDPDMISYASGSGVIIIEFPNTELPTEGEVRLYRPSDHRLDKLIQLELDDQNTMRIPVDRLLRGYWKVLVTWKSEGKNYFAEKRVTL